MVDVPSTGAWDTWQYVYIDSLVLNSTDKSFVFQVDRGTFNIGFFEFERIGDISLAETIYMNSYTLNENTILLNTNKDLDSLSDIILSDFELRINDNKIDIQNILFPIYPRSIILEIDQKIQPADSILISYNGNSLKSTDNEQLSVFSDKFIIFGKN